MLKLFTPSHYDGKDRTEALAYLTRAKVFFAKLPKDFQNPDKFMLLLNLLTGDTVAWALPFYSRLEDSPPPWVDFAAFEADFKAHFCAVEDQAAAFNELKQLC